MFSFSDFEFLFGQGDVVETVVETAKKAKDVAWYSRPTFYLPIAIAIAVLSWLFGQWAANKTRMKEMNWRITLILICLGWSVLIISTNWPPRLGVDLKGGVTFIGQVDLAKDTEQKIEVTEIISQLKRRIDPSGTREIVLRQLGQDKIEIIIPDVDDAEAQRVWNNLIQAGFLEFRIMADSRYGEHQAAITRARDMAATQDANQTFVYDSTGEDKLAQWVDLGKIVRPGSTKVAGYKVVPDGTQLIRDKRTGQIINWSDAFATGYRQMGGNNAGLELDRWATAQGYEQLQTLMMIDKQNVDGGLLSGTSQTIDSLARPAVRFTFKPEGARLFGVLTMTNKPKSETEKKRLGIVLDNQLLSAPVINSAIFSEGTIEGQFTDAEVKDLIAILKGGRLKAALKKQPISQDNVASSLGEEMKTKGLRAIGISFVIVLLFMIFYYRFSGIVACMALIANLVFIVALMMAIRFPFSLTGLAGLVLTVGMSVDANVLIFERIREEIEKSATLRMAIRNGFDRATTTIVDANLTTLITAIILYVIGTEQIKGFAVALILGILMSMFTAIFCSRVVFDIAERQKWITKLGMLRFVKATTFDFIGKRYVAMAVSALIIVVGLTAVFMRGPDIFAHDLRGGTTARVVFNTPLKPNVVRDRVNKKLDEMESQDPKGKRHVIEVTPVTATGFADETVYKFDSDFVIDEDNEESQNRASEKLRGVIEDVFKGDLELRKFTYTLVSNVNSSDSPSNEKSGSNESTKEKEAPNSGGGSVPDLNAPENKAPEGDKKEDESSKAKADDKSETADEKASEKSKDAKSSDDKSAKEKGEEDVDCFSQDSKKEEKSEQDKKADDKKADDKKADDKKADDKKADDTTAKGEPKEADETKPVSPGENGRFVATANVEFKYAITAESVIGELIDGSIFVKDAPPLLTNDDVVPNAEGYDGDTSFKSKEWEVTLRTSNSEMASRILNNVKSQVDARIYMPSISGVGGSIAADTQLQALGAIIASLIGIVAYIWIRFQKVFFGLAAVVALIHDVLVVLGAIAISMWFKDIPGIMIENFKISLPVIAAFLTIIGYSLNDTIVVFDRIREVRGKNPDLTKAMINRSIGQTLSRTVLTSVTTFMVVFILFAIGGDTIHGFAFALVIGVIVGTYSSIFVASPVLLYLMGKETVKPAKSGT